MADDKDTSNEDEQNTGVDDVETSEDSEEDEGATNSNDDDSNDEDESNDDENDSEDGDSDDNDSDDSDDDDEEDSEFKKAFSQIKGETPEEYIPNLEDAYRKSSAEAKRLVHADREKQERLDQINAAVAKNPELAKLIMEATEEGATPATVDTAVLKIRNDYEEQVANDLETFLGEHETLANDEGLIDEFMDNVATLGAAARKKGKAIDPMTAYKKALGMMDYDLSQDKKDKLADAAKGTASKPKTPASAKPKAKSGEKPKLTSEQIAYGKKFGLTEKQLLATLDKKS
jgi:hypothetical protein